MTIKLAWALVLVAAGAVPALADPCSEPIPPAPVDGATATKEQINQAREDTVNFIKASDDYQSCLFADLKAQKLQAAKDKKPFPPSIEDAVNQKVQDNQKEKEKVGGEYNAAAITYKNKHPGS
ncbi:MAG TPA: hypothetical protein VG891_09815 [Rhizomicrobium sp.]|nr:hypothetical protein [Rhizomicrobium sp.]